MALPPPPLALPPLVLLPLPPLMLPLLPPPQTTPSPCVSRLVVPPSPSRSHLHSLTLTLALAQVIDLCFRARDAWSMARWLFYARAVLGATISADQLTKLVFLTLRNAGPWVGGVGG